MSPAARPAAGTDGALIAHATPVYRFGRGCCAAWLGLLNRFRAEGKQHLPAEGGALIVSNHQSFLDIPAIASATPRHVAFVARASLADSRFLDWLMRQSGCVLIRPNTPDRAALTGMIAHLEAGDCVAVFPEGTRTRDGALGTFRGGAAVAARRARVPIVPAAIHGAYEAWPRSRKLPRPGRVTVRFGAPIPADADEPIELAKARIADMLEDSAAGR